MAEDAAATCKRGHPRTRENVYPSRACKLCRPIHDALYNKSPGGHSRYARYDASPGGETRTARYHATTKAWVTKRAWELRGAREIILEKLEALKGEEAECQTSLEYLMQMQSS